MIKKTEFIKDLGISTFSKPILRELGVEAIMLVTFDVVLGPIAYITRITNKNIEYLKFLEDIAHMGEFYTGISHAQIEKVTTITDEVMIIGRAKRKVNELETIDIAVAIVEKETYQKEIVKMLNFAVRTAYGNPDNFSELIDRTLLQYQSKELLKKKREEEEERERERNGDWERRNGFERRREREKEGERKKPQPTMKEIAKQKTKNYGNIGEHFQGIFFIDFESNKIFSGEMPDWIEGQKISTQKIANELRERFAQGEIPPKKERPFTILTLEGKQALIITAQKKRYALVCYPTTEGMTNLKEMVELLDNLIKAVAEIEMRIEEETMKEMVTIIDERINLDERKKKGRKTTRINREKKIMKEVAEIILRAAEIMPKKIISRRDYERFEGKLQKEYFKNYGEIYEKFDGKTTALEISYKENIPLEEIADFILFCMTRKIVQLFSKHNGSKRRKQKQNNLAYNADERSIA
jgi:hypothetical protein